MALASEVAYSGEVAERLELDRVDVPVLTRDRHWTDFAEKGRTTARIVTF